MTGHYNCFTTIFSLSIRILGLFYNLGERMRSLVLFGATSPLYLLENSIYLLHLQVLERTKSSTSVIYFVFFFVKKLFVALTLEENKWILVEGGLNFDQVGTWVSLCPTLVPPLIGWLAGAAKYYFYAPFKLFFTTNRCKVNKISTFKKFPNCWTVSVIKSIIKKL